MKAINSTLLVFIFAFNTSFFLMTPHIQAQLIEETEIPLSEAFVLEAQTLSEGTVPFPFALALEEGKLDQFIIDHGIERSDRAASYFLLKGEHALSQGRGEEAIRLGEMAKKISPASPLPSFFLADAYWELDPMSPLTAILYNLKGVLLTLKDFSLLFTVLSPYFVLFLLAILLALLTFIVFSLASYASMWIHDISEFSNKVVHPIAAGLLFTLFLFAPLLLGFPILWFFLFSFILFWRFYSRSEKGVILTFLLALGSAAWVLPIILTLFTIKGSFLFDEMSRNAKGDYLWVSPPVKAADAGWEGAFIQASYEMTQGAYNNAEGLYLQALERNSDSPKIFNNLGNIAFYLKDYQKAIGYYQKAISLSPELISAHYNLSQTYREMLSFSEGEALYAKAKAISQKTVDTYAMRSARFPNFPVIEERFSGADLFSLIFNENKASYALSDRMWQSWMGPIPLRFSPLLSLIYFAALIAASHFFSVLFSAKPCAFCKRAVCKKCVKRLLSYQVCHQCQMEYKYIQTKSEFKIIEEAVRKVPMKLYPLFLLPGGGHLAAHKTAIAFLFLVSFYLAMSSLLNWGYLIPPSEWYLHPSGSLMKIVALILVIVLAAYHLIRMREKRIWL